MVYVWVALGSALGGIARYWCSGWVAENIGEAFPWGTLLVNIIGSFVIGMLAGLSDFGGRDLLSPSARQFMMIGICGGYTTFSSFSLQTLMLIRAGEWTKAMMNASLSVLLCMIAVWCGYALMVSMSRLRG